MQSSILVVDDEDSLRLGMKARLESQGFTVDTAANGEEAMGKIQEQNYDLVLLDINMPFVNGIQVLEFITAEHRDTDVIMLTGFSDFSLAMECLKKGAKDYLVKPIDTSELVARLKSFLRALRKKRTMSFGISGNRRCSSICSVRFAASTSSCNMPSRRSKVRAR
jgi:YesN/AraC family two-component response regulator